MQQKNYIGKFFYSTFIKDDGNLPVFDNIITTKIEDIAFDYECVLEHIIKLPNKFSSGPDNIPAIILKQHANVLLLIFQQSYDRGELPDEWKQANVTAI